MKSSNLNLHNPDLDGESFLLKGSEKGVLLFHGFTATTWEVRPLAEYIHAQTGSSVAAPLLPGHGTTPENLSNCQFLEWLKAADSAYSDLRSNYRSIIIGGESMGGLLALHLAAQHPEINGILLFAPALIIPRLGDAQILKWFMFGTAKKNLEPPLEGFLPWQGYKINPLKAVIELGKLQKCVRKLLPQVIQPAIIFQGENDETIDKHGSMLIYRTISSANRQYIDVENCGHCILLDKQHPRIYQLAVQFIQQFHAAHSFSPIMGNQ